MGELSKCAAAFKLFGIIGTVLVYILAVILNAVFNEPSISEYPVSCFEFVNFNCSIEKKGEMKLQYAIAEVH